MSVVFITCKMISKRWKIFCHFLFQVFSFTRRKKVSTVGRIFVLKEKWFSAARKYGKVSAAWEIVFTRWLFPAVVKYFLQYGKCFLLVATNYFSRIENYSHLQQRGLY